MNVTDGVEIGKEQMKEFYATSPDGFYSSIKKKVKLIKAENTCAIGDMEVYSTEVIYTRIICLMGTSSKKTKRCPEVRNVTCFNVVL